MPYRIASDPWERGRRILRLDLPRRGLPLSRRVALAMASVGALMLVTLGIDVAFRPTLGPDTISDRDSFAYDSALLSSRRFLRAESSACGGDVGEPRDDVNRALRSDEPTGPDVPPEGTGAARRRYVRPDPRDSTLGGVIQGTTTLVSASPRRH